MAVYKVPQDVEAEDKFIGPLSFKQFLFAGGALISGYITYLLASSSAWFLSIIFILPFIVFAFLAFPWSRDQPTELWLASRIRFLIMPRKKIWDQSGIKELVKVTVPKKVVNALTDGLSGNEVRNRMGALASMIDSRGWVVKQNRYQTVLEDNDRLIDPVPPEVSDKNTILSTTVDIMDEGDGTLARQFDNLLQKSETSQNVKTKQLIENARNPDGISQQTQKNINTKQENFWFLNQNAPAINTPGLATFKKAPTVAPGATTNPTNTATPQSTILSQELAGNPMLDGAELLKKVHDKQIQNRLQTRSTYEKVIPPLDQTPVKPEATIQPKNPVTPLKDPGIISLSRSNDLNIETLQRQGDKKGLSDDEVVVSLH